MTLNTGPGNNTVDAYVAGTGGFAPITVNGGAGSDALVVGGDGDSPVVYNYPSSTPPNSGKIVASYPPSGPTRTVNYTGISSFGSAHAAVTVASITGVANPTNQPESNIEVTFTAPINTGSLSTGALTLTLNNGGNLAGNSLTLSLVSGTTSTYLVGGLSSLTAAQGSYKLTVSAAAVFDQNGFAGTGSASVAWLMDSTAPSSSVVNSLGTTQTSDTFSVPVSFSDPAGPGGTPASGVATLELFVSINNGPFNLSQSLTLATPEASGTATFSFVGADRNTYAFHCIAIDAAGNTEIKGSNTIEASTSVPDLNPPVTHVLSSSSYANGVFTLNWSGTDPDQNTGTPAGSISLVNVYVIVDGGTPSLVGQVERGHAERGRRLQRVIEL